MSSILSCAYISALLTYFEKICVPFATKNFLLTSSCYFNCSARLYYSLRSKWKLNWWSYDFQENLATCQIFNLWLVLQTSQRQSKYPNFSLLYVVLKRLCIEITSLFSLFCDVLKYSAYISSQLKKNHTILLLNWTFYQFFGQFKYMFTTIHYITTPASKTT